MKPQSDIVLRRQGKSTPETFVSIPRVFIYNCDQRVARRSSLHALKTRRPHSVQLDQDNYLYLQQINEVETCYKNKILKIDCLIFAC